MVTGTLEMIF